MKKAAPQQHPCSLPDLGPRGQYLPRPLVPGTRVCLTWGGPTFTVARVNQGSATVARGLAPKKRKAWDNKAGEFREWEVAGTETSNISANSFVYPGVEEPWTEVMP